MSDQDQPSKTRTPDESKSSLSDLLRIGSEPSAMLLGATPEEGAGEPEAGGNASEPAAEGEKSEGKSEAGKEEAPVAAPMVALGAERAPAKPGFPGGQALGILIAVAGVLLIVVPMFSASLAQSVEHVVDPLASAGVLIVGGLLLSASSALRRNLRGVQSTVDDVRRETARLERIAADSRAVLDALQGVRLENTALHQDVVKLQAKLKRLTDIVSNPDYAGSIFRLAASVDSLGKHVEVYMKDQFGALQQRLSSVAQQSEHAEHQLKAALGQVHALTKEQLRVQQLAVQEGFGHLSTSSDKSIARIDQSLQVTARIEASIQSQQAALAKGWASLSDRMTQSVSQVASDLNDLRANLDRQVESQSASLRVEFEGLDDRIGQAERNQSSGIQQIAEHIQGQIASRIGELQQGLKQLAELSTRGQKQVSDEIGDLGVRVDKQTREQLASLQQTREKTAEATRAAKGELAASLTDLRAQVEKFAREQTAALQKSSQESRDAAVAAQSELAASLGALRSHVEQLAREQTAEATRAAKGELAATLGELRSHAEQLAREQAAAAQRSSQEAREVAGAAQSELSASLEQIGSRLEKALEARTRNLATDMMELAEMVGSITTEVRSCIAESIVRIVTATGETAAAQAASPEWPRIEVPNLEPNDASNGDAGLERSRADGWPESESIEVADESSAEAALPEDGELPADPHESDSSPEAPSS